MRIRITALDFQLTPALARHVESRLRLALGTALDQIEAVLVRLSDINGPKGGHDKRCQVIVRLRPLRTLVVDAVDRDLYSAVDEAATRAREAAWREILRRRTRGRQFAQRLVRQVFA